MSRVYSSASFARGYLYLGLLCGVWSSAILATPPPQPMGIPDLVGKADLIVAGRVSEAHEHTGDNGFTTIITETFLVSPDRVLKGSVPPSVRTLQVRTGDNESGVDDKDYGLFFLVKRDDATYRMVDTSFPNRVAFPSTVPGNGADDALSRVADDLTHVLTVPEAQIADPANGIAGRAQRIDPTLVTSRQGPHLTAVMIYNEVLNTLKTIPYAVAGKYIRPLTRSQQLFTKLWANTAMLNGQDLSNLDSVISILVDPPADQKDAVEFLALALEDKLRSGQFVPALSKLLGSRDAQTRYVAANDVADVAILEKNKIAIQLLAKRGINDRDENVRWASAQGLEGAVHGRPTYLPSATPEEEEKHKKAYIAQWKKWASENVK